MVWAPPYITGAELLEYVRADEDSDTELAAEIAEASSRAVDGTCGRQFGKVASPETRRFTATYDRYLGIYVATVDDVQDLTGLTVVATASGLDVTAQTGLLPANAVLKGRPYEQLQVPGTGVYDVTVAWGWNAVPAPAVLATKLQGSRLWARRDSPYGVAGSPAEGTELRLLARVDPDVEVTLRRAKLVRTWWAM